MKIAVLFTGQMRTFARVSECLRRNLIEPNHAVVFAAVTSSESESTLRNRLEAAFPGIEIGGVVVHESFRDAEFDKIMQLIEGRPAVHPEIFEACTVRDNILWNMDFLRRSGSVVQFYQVRWAWDLLLEYEKSHAMRFDVCVRSRLDNLLTEPLHLREFFSAPWASDEISARSLGNPRMESILRKEDPPNGLTGVPRSRDEVVWTFGFDWFWVATRPTFSLLANMVYHYGRWGGPARSPFSAEHFFVQFCNHHGLVQWVFLQPPRRSMLGDYEISPMYNTDHPGEESVREDPWVFSLLR